MVYISMAYTIRLQLPAAFAMGKLVSGELVTALS